MMPTGFGFPSNTILDQETLSALQKVIEKFGIKRMSSDEQVIFFLEFARVANLRFEKKLASAPATKDKNQIFISEIKKLADDLSNQSRNVA